MSENPLATWLAEAAAASAPPPAEEARAPEPPAPTSCSTPPAQPAPPRRLRRLAALPWAVAGVLALLALARGALPLPTSAADTGTAPPAAIAETETAPIAETGNAPSAAPDPRPSPEPVAGSGGADDGADGSADDGAEGGAAGGVPAADHTTDGPAPDDAADGPAADEAAVTTAAVVAMRLALTGTGEDGDRYVDLVSADGVRWYDDVAVVTATAVLLEGGGGVWERTRTGRYAIALRSGPDGVGALGPPWPVPGAPADPPAPAGTPEPVDDEDLAAALLAALDRAGYAEPALQGLLRPPGPAVLRLRVRGSAPGEAAPRDHDLLLDASPPHDVLGSTRGDAP